VGGFNPTAAHHGLLGKVVYARLPLISLVYVRRKDKSRLTNLSIEAELEFRQLCQLRSADAESA
jgi:hypothetical protein